MAKHDFKDGDIIYDNCDKQLFSYKFSEDDEWTTVEPEMYRYANENELAYWNKNKPDKGRHINYDAEKREEVRGLCQKYVLSNYKDVGCANWNEMQQKMADEIMAIFGEPKKSIGSNFIWIKINDTWGYVGLAGGVSDKDYDKHLTIPQIDELLGKKSSIALTKMGKQNSLSAEMRTFLESKGWSEREDMFKSNGDVHAFCFTKKIA